MKKNYSILLLSICSVVLLVAMSLVVSCSKDPVADPVNTPDFTASVAAAYKVTAPTGIPVTFTDKSTNVSAYSWDFGDGKGTSTDPSPTYVYSLPGTYTVVLTTAAKTGLLPATAKKTVDVVVTDPTASLPNLVQGGEFEAADESKWTKIFSGQRTGTTFNHVNATFGSTKNLPTGGAGGGFNVSNSLPGQEAGSVFYQSVNLSAGIYKYSVLIKHEGENRTGTVDVALKDYWFETLIGKTTPTFNSTIPAPAVNDNGYNDNDPTPEIGPFTNADGSTSATVPGAIAGFIFNGWTGRAVSTDYPATDGTMPFVTFGRKARSKADKNGIFEVKASNAGVYYVIIKAGKGGGGGFGTNGITLDNMRLVKVQ